MSTVPTGIAMHEKDPLNDVVKFFGYISRQVEFRLVQFPEQGSRLPFYHLKLVSFEQNKKNIWTILKNRFTI